MSRVVAYIDGLNLYYGMRSRFGRTFHWLDIEQLCKQLLRPNQQLARIDYFTALVPEPATSHARQTAYLDALQECCSHLRIRPGRFQQKTLTCAACQATWTQYEEKESDVNLATALVEDAARDNFDIALLVSGDSDLCPAVRSAHRLRPDRRIVAVFPPGRHSSELRRTASGVYWLGRDKLARSQLPTKVAKRNCVVIERPAYWT